MQSIEGGGWGARPSEDGEPGTVSVCQGDVRNGSIEGIELKCPVLVEERALRRDSCGAGKYRGGLGIDVRVRNFVDGTWSFERPRRSLHPAWGLWGGEPGGASDYLLERPGESRFSSPQPVRNAVPAQSRAIVRTGGGGGWGNPLERDPEAVRWDVIEGFVSREAAERDYGVAVGADYAIDTVGTSALRQAAKRGRAS